MLWRPELRIRFLSFAIVFIVYIFLASGLSYGSETNAMGSDAESIKLIYQEFNSEVINPPNPEIYRVFAIKDGDTYLETIKILSLKIHRMLSGISYENDQKYGLLLRKMRDVLYADTKYIPVASKKNISQDIFWFELHNKNLKEIEVLYAKLFPITNEKMARDYVYSLTDIVNWNKNNPAMISIIKGYYQQKKGKADVGENLLGFGVISTKIWNDLNLKDDFIRREGDSFIIERNVCMLPNLPPQAELSPLNFAEYTKGAKIVRIRETLTSGAQYTCETVEVISNDPPLNKIFHYE